MGLNSTPSADRVHIGFFGRRNAGKSSLVNAVTGQDLALVSEIKGTTTDPVYKAMELLPLGPVLIIDTPGIDDEGALGEMRVRRARQVLNKTDAAILVLDGSAPNPDAEDGLYPVERELLDLFRAKSIPHIMVWNKRDLLPEELIHEVDEASAISVSAKTGYNIHGLKERIAAAAAVEENEQPLAADLLRPGELALLIVPIDKAAPKGRLILPQQQTIRDILEAGAAAVVTRETELAQTLNALAKPPALAITDSQVFDLAAARVPESIPLTSFSILFARRKGSLAASIQGVRALDRLKSGDAVLIAEGCTHHRQCDDIGTVKLPRWIREHSRCEPDFRFCSGGSFPEDLSPFTVIIHCGGCMLNRREIQYRRLSAEDQSVPFTNYGIAIAHMRGILRRGVALFPEIAALLEG
jgi:[FeFe] hydrogenase H-cluster maturation GTPase HydF